MAFIDLDGAPGKTSGGWIDLDAPEPDAGLKASDPAKLFVAGAVGFTGGAVRGVGEMLREADEGVYSTAIKILASRAASFFGVKTPDNFLTGTNPLTGVAGAIERGGDSIKDTLSQAAKNELAQSKPSGDITKPSTWSMGKDPSIKGYLLQGAELFGQVVPFLVGAYLTKGQSTQTQLASGAALGGAAGGGFAAKEAGDLVRSATTDELQDGSSVFRDLVANGMSPDKAKEQTATEAEKWAFRLTTPISAAGGMATSAVLSRAGQGAIGQVVGKYAGGRVGASVVGSALEEGIQETAEEIATRKGLNVGAGMDRSLTEDTFGNAVLGMVGGVGPGFVGGVVHGRKRASTAVEAETAAMPLLAAPIIQAGATPSVDVDAVRASGEAQAAAEALYQERDREQVRVTEAFRKLDLARTPGEAIAAAYEAAGLTTGAVLDNVTGGLVSSRMDEAIDRAARATREEPAYAALEQRKEQDLAALQQVHREAGLLPVTDQDLQPDTSTPAPAEPQNPAMKMAMERAFRDRTLAGMEGVARDETVADVAARAAGIPQSPGSVALESGPSIDAGAHGAAMSQENDLTEPTPAQKEAGNYKKGQVKLAGLSVSVENPEGSIRRGKDPSKPWQVTMQDHYGYIKGVPARAPDKEHVDVFIKPGTPENYGGDVYVVDQNNQNGRFDEPKVMIGYDNITQAREGYLRNYSPGWKGLRNITAVPMNEFKMRLLDEAAFKKPQPYSPRYYLDDKNNRRLLQPGMAAPKGARVFNDLQAVDSARRARLQANRKPDHGRDSLNEWIAKRGGLDISERLDTIGDEKNQAYNASQWLFRNGGEAIDELARRAAEDGYLSTAEADDVDGGVAALKEKIRDEFGGTKRHFSDWNTTVAQDQADRAEEDSLMAAAEAYEIQTAGLSLEQIRDAVQQRQETESALEETEGDREARLEREAMQADNLLPEHYDDNSDFLDDEQGAAEGESQAAGSDAPARQRYIDLDATEVAASEEEPARGNQDPDAQRPDRGEEAAGVDDEDAASLADGRQGDGPAVQGGTASAERSLSRDGGQPADDSGRSVDDDRKDAKPARNAQRGEADRRQLELTGQTPEDLLRQKQLEAAQAQIDAAKAQKEAADAQLASFTLAGSERPADQAAARGQRELTDDRPAGTKFSRGRRADGGIDRKTFDAALAEAFGAKTAKRIADAGIIVLLATQDQLPAHVVPYLRDGDTVYGFYDPRTDRTYAVLENLTADQVKSLALHEIGVHYGFERMLGQDLYAKVLKRIDLMYRAGNRNVRAAREAAEREATDSSQVPEETLAYLVQSHPAMGMVQEIIARVKAFLFRELGILGNTLTEADLAMLARAAVMKAGLQEQVGTAAPAFARHAPSEEFRKAVDRLLKNKSGEASAALFNTDVGPIDLVYGSEGTSAGAHADGYGLAHILQAHPEIDPYALEGIVASAAKTREKGNTVELETPDHRAVIKLDWEGSKKKWLLTAFEIDGDLAGTAERIGVDGSAESAPLANQEAKAEGNVPQKDGGVKKPSFARAAKQGANPMSWDVPEPSRLDDFIRVMQDKHVDTKRVLAAIRQRAGALADAVNVYLQEELFHGRAAKRTEEFLDKEMKPLLTEMAGRGVTVAELEQYLHARHAEEANEHIAAINPQMPDGGSGMDTADARAYLAGLTPAKKRAYEALAKRVDAINDRTRQTLVSYGLESQATVDAWKQMFDYYVPLQREDMGDGPGIGQGFSVKGPASKSRTGSKRKVVDILANVAMQRERAIVRGEKNRVALALIGLAKANPNKDFWRVDKPPMIQRIDDRTGVLRKMVDPLYKSRDNVVMARTLDANGEVQEHSVVFNEHDERAVKMSAALKNLDLDELGQVLGTAAKATRYFASINTQYNLVFGVVNLLRDMQGALFNLTTTPIAGKQKEVLKHTLSALKGIYIDLRDTRAGKPSSSAWAKLWEEFRSEGGQTGYRDMFRTSKDRGEAIERELKRVTEGKAKQFGRAVFDWLSDYNNAMENATRLAAYKVALDHGMSKQQAASLAKNLTVNFNRKGQVATQAGALYAFFNASMQGSARLAETLNGPKGRQIILGGVALGVMQALALAAAGFDEDEPPDFVRERNVIIPIGGDRYVTIPMPLGLHVLPNIGRIGTEFALSGFKAPAKRLVQLAGVFAEAFNPIGNAGLSLQTIAPTVIDPLAALSENRDWTGKPIARQDFNKLAPTPGHTRSKDTASTFSKTVSKALNWATGGTNYKPGLFSPTPDQIDYLIGQVTGGIGREVMKVEQTVTSAFSGEELPTHKIPLVGRLYGSTEGPAPQANRFYEALREINEHEAEIKGRRKHHEPLGDYLKENPEAKLVHAANAVERRVSELRRRKRELMERDASRDAIKAIDFQITAHMERFNNRVQEIKAQ